MRTTHTLKTLRLSRNLSQLDVREKIGVPQSTLACWESAYNQPNADNLSKLQDLYNFKGNMLEVWENTKARCSLNIPDSLLTDSDN